MIKSIICIIIPLYNEEASLPLLLERLELTAGKIESDFNGRVEYVFIDDGSGDNSFQVLKSWDFGQRYVRLLQFSRNFGKEAALSAGISAASHADAAILMDADLQHPPEMIFDFLRIWREKNVDSVFAYKANRSASEGKAKAVLSRLFYWIINRGLRYKLSPDAGDFRLVNKRFIAALCSLTESERFMKGLYSWVGFRQIGVPLIVPPRLQGTSNFNTLRLIGLTLDAITSFTTAPLRLMALFGGIVTLLSSMYGLFIIIQHYIYAHIATGITSVLALTAFFGGTQLLFLGLLGEYIGKAVLEAKRRPSFIVADDIIRAGNDIADRG